jgi:hypothetical protein
LKPLFGVGRGAIGLIDGPRRIILKTTEALGDKEMAQPKEPDDRSVHIPEHLIETINKLVRTSRQMLSEIGREPTPEELAVKLAMPGAKVRKLLDIAKEPISLKTAIGDAPV